MEETKQISSYRKSLREKILDTAMNAFAAQGIRAVKMDDIAQSLGISKRTLYEIYDNKEVLLFEGLKKYKAMQEHRFQMVVDESSSVMDIILYVYRQKVEEFRVVNPAFYSDIARYPNLLTYLEADREKWRNYTQDVLARGIAQGYFRDDIDFSLTTRAFEAASNLIFTQQLYRNYTMEQLFHSIFFVILRGICTQRGIEMFKRLDV